MSLMPALYLPHGAGPCFFMEWTMGPADTWEQMGKWLSQLAATLGTMPQAIVVISAHWESPMIAVTSAPSPSLIYDYYGFPDHTYQIRYAPPGSPGLATEIYALLTDAGIAAIEDPEHGFDHGVFVPLKLIFPDASIPVVQLSLHHSLDPAVHLDIGRALAPLRERNILILGSGMSYHNLPVLMSGVEVIEDSDRFDDWLHESCLMVEESRANRLRNWHKASAARSAHPREEHLLPLMVAAGAGIGANGRRIFTGRVMGSQVAAFQFG